MIDKETLINTYFEKTLTDSEQAIFDQLLIEDKQFREEVRFQEQVKKAITREALKKQLQSFETPKKKPFFISISIAASIVVFFGIGIFMLNQSPDNEVIFKEYYQTYPNVIAPIVRGETIKDKKNEAFYSYDSGNYEKALQLFTELYATEKEDYALFYKTLSLVELKRYEEANASFATFDLTKNNAFTPYIKWYKALNHIKLKQNKEAISLLKELATTDNPQQKVAKELLLELQ